MLAPTLTLLTALCTLPGPTEEVDALLEKVPVADPAAQRELAAALVRLGDEGVADLVRRLSPAGGGGDDARARFALGSLAHHAARPGAQEERKAIATSIASRLDGEGAPEVTGFLLTLLDFCGKDEVVPQVVALLDAEATCAPACRTLVAIGTALAEEQLALALARAKGAPLVAVVKALGDLGSRKASGAIGALAASSDPALRGAALWALASAADPQFAGALAKAQSDGSLPSATRNGLQLRYLGRQAETGDAQGAARGCRLILKGAGAASPAHLRSAALSLLADVEGPGSFEEIFAAALGEDRQLAAAALSLARRIDSPAGPDATVDRWAGALGASTGEARARIAELLGARGSERALPALEALLDGGSPEEQLAALGAIARIRCQGPLPALLSAIGESSGARKAKLLRALSRVGGGQALEALRAALADEAPAVREAALATLIAWPDASAGDVLLEVARTAKDLGVADQAFRAHVRLAREARFPPPRMLEIYREALGAARSVDQRRLVVDGLQNLKSIGSIDLLSTLLEDSELAQDAERAIVSAALPRKSGRGGVGGARVAAALERVIARTGDAALKARAAEYLASLAPFDRWNLAEGRPARSNVGSQGEQTPDRAVDGDSESNESAWFGERWPSWLEVDLERLAPVDRVNITFWFRDDRHYQYTVELSADGKEWKQVVDRSQNTEPCTREGFDHRFETTPARYVRLNVLKNSANEAAHVHELKVYGPHQK